MIAKSLYEKINVNQAIPFVIYFFFLLPFVGSYTPAYLFVILYILFNSNNLKFKWIDVFLTMALFIWLILKLGQTEIGAAITLFKYYFGFFLFYLFFSSVKFQFKLNQLLIFLSALIILEALLVNSIIDPSSLKNYPVNDTDSFKTAIMGFYQRPYSFGSNTTISSTLLMVVLYAAYTKWQLKVSKLDKKVLFLTIVALIMLGSGTGYAIFLLFIIYLVNPFKNALYSFLSVTIILVFYYLIFILNVGQYDGLEKLSTKYLEFLYELKSVQIDIAFRELRRSTNSFLIGVKFKDAGELIIWNDFSWRDLFYCTGYFGFFFIWITLILKTNKYNFVVILILGLGAFHYGAIFTLPGQILLGYFLSKNYRLSLMSNSLRT